MSRIKKLKVLDLFSGIGGFAIGLDNAGFETVAFCEIDKHCHKILNKHWPRVPIFTDVTKLKYERVFNKEGKDLGNCLLHRSELEFEGEECFENFAFTDIDVICGGFPCQDVSFAGARKGIKEGTRSGLWNEYRRLIDEIRPKYVIIENVEYLRKNGLGTVLNDLARIGYDAEWSCITANSVGYPHQRKRLFIIAYPCGQRLDKSHGKKGQVQINEEWKNESNSEEWKGRKPEFVEIRPILSRGAFDHIRNSYSDERASVSKLRRVTDGIPEGLDETRRQQRIKQLGNSIVPRIAEIIGKAILEREKQLQE